MKKIILFIFFINLVFANEHYGIYYNGAKVGDIKDITTIKDGYLKAKATGFFSLFIWYDTLVIYNKKKYTPDTTQKDTKYKKDNNLILDLLYELESNKPKNKQLDRKKVILNISCENDICTYTRTNKKTNKTSSGEIEYKNNKLYRLHDKDADLIIELKEKL